MMNLSYKIQGLPLYILEFSIKSEAFLAFFRNFLLLRY